MCAHLWVGVLDLLLNFRSLPVRGLAHALQFCLVIWPELTPAQHNAVLSIFWHSSQLAWC